MAGLLFLAQGQAECEGHHWKNRMVPEPLLGKLASDLQEIWGGLKSQAQKMECRSKNPWLARGRHGQEPLSFSASSRMCTIKQKWKIIRSERGLALSEAGRKVRLNPICQKTKGIWRGRCGRRKAGAASGQGERGRRPPQSPSPPSPRTQEPLLQLPIIWDVSPFIAGPSAPRSAAVRMWPRFGLPRLGVPGHCVRWCMGSQALMTLQPH